MDSTTKRLKRVLISGDDQVVSKGEQAFEAVRDALRRSYGPISDVENKRDSVSTNRKAAWFFPTTTVEVSYFNSPPLTVKWLNVSYRPRAPGDGSPERRGVARELHNFRKTTWGMSRGDVKRSEQGEPVLENDVQLAYEDTLAGLQCLVAYIFVQDQLVRANYLVTQKHTNKNSYLLDTAKLKGLLESKYGKPLDEQVVWLNDLFKRDQQKYGLAVSSGHLRMTYEWETERSDITLALYGDNFKITLRIEYKSKELESIGEAEDRKKALEKL